MPKTTVLLGSFFLCSLAACGGPELGDSEALDQEALRSIASSPLHNPEFARKLRDPDGYRKDLSVLLRESLCGRNDLQHVNSYNGMLGQTKAFVVARQRQVGALETTASQTSSKYCTGTLIANDLFITAGHCIDSSTTREYVAFNYERKAGSTTQLTQEHFKITAIVDDGAKRGLDYAILRLAGTPGVKFGTTKFNAVDPASNAILTIIQHPNGEAKQVEVGHMGGTSGNYLKYGDLDTLPGSSGSGVINAAGELVGIHTNGGCTSSSGFNTGVRMKIINPKLP